tara:strand:+ start:93 stop:422 length:330 start_codon:yes stop_codon:yes gene_type:complete
MKDISRSARRHPKIAATIVFTLLVSIFSFMWGYRKDTNRKDKDGNAYSTKHHFWNGMKWTGIVIAIMFLLTATMALILKMDFWEMFFFGGDIINGIGQIIIALISALTN